MRSNVNTKINYPTFFSLYSDNAKTQGYNFGFLMSGLPTFCGFLAGSIMTMPFVMICGILNSLWAAAPGCIGGTILGVPTFAVGSTFGSVCIAPFTTIAAYWRNFQPDTEIKKNIDRLLILTDTLDQQEIISTVIRQYKDFFFSSYDSLDLIRILNDENYIKYTHEEKWQYLLDYMSDKTYTHAYTNNGKKLFNIILNIANSTSISYRIQLQTDLKNERLSEHYFKFLSRVDQHGRNYLHRAVINNDVTIVKELAKTTLLNRLTKSKPKRVSPLYLAVERGHTEVAIALIEAGARFNSKVVLLAIYEGHLDILKALHKKKPISLNNHYKDNRNRNILHIAAHLGQIDIVHYLTRKGMDIHAKTTNDRYGEIAIQLADKNYPDVAKAMRVGVENIRKQLKELYIMANHPKWNNHGYQLFGSGKKPDGIVWILERLSHIRHADQINNMKASTLVHIASQFWDHDFGYSFTRDKESTQKLLNFANNLGENTSNLLPTTKAREVVNCKY